jgi:hypothetical protein
LAKIIRFDVTGRKPRPGRKKPECAHKQVIVYTVYRTVRCAFCGAELDPFDVLVDVFKAYVPPDNVDREEKRLLREIARRSGNKSTGDKPSRE